MNLFSDLRAWWRWRRTRGQVRPPVAFIGTVTRQTSAYWLIEDDEGQVVLGIPFFANTTTAIAIGDRVEVEPLYRPVGSGNIPGWRVTRRVVQ